MGVGQADKVETQMCKIAWSTKGPSVEETRCEWNKGEKRGERERERPQRRGSSLLTEGSVFYFEGSGGSLKGFKQGSGMNRFGV